MSRSFAGGQVEKGHSGLSRQRGPGAEGSDDKGFDMSCTSVGLYPGRGIAGRFLESDLCV